LAKVKAILRNCELCLQFAQRNSISSENFDSIVIATFRMRIGMPRRFKPEDIQADPGFIL
jgi:hypothetical protein